MMLNITPLLVMWATIQPRVSLVLPLIRFTAASSIEKNHRINSIHRAIRFQLVATLFAIHCSHCHTKLDAILPT